MADFMAAMTSNQPRVTDQQSALAVINGYYFDNDVSVGVEADPASDQPYLTLFGYGWPGAWKIPAGVKPDDFEPDYDVDSADGFEEFLNNVAPFLAEPLTVQAVGHTKCRFPFSACEWHIRPGRGAVEVNGFKHRWDEPLLVEITPSPNSFLKGVSMMALHVNDPEFHTILAALRFYQEQHQTDPAHRSAWIDDLATAGGEVDALTAGAIDDLCQRINTESA